MLWLGRARERGAAKFNEVLQATNRMVQDGVLVDEKVLSLKWAELDALAKKGASRSACVRAALLFWIVQHNNHLHRDADGVGSTKAARKDEQKKAKVQRASVEEKRRGNTFDVNRKFLERDVCVCMCVCVLCLPVCLPACVPAYTSLYFIGLFYIFLIN